MNNKLHVFVSHGFVDMDVDLRRYEGDYWIKVMSFPKIYSNASLVLNYTC
ncbi:hypothetical protein Hanom_Chr15g01364961 [Helianthus anomalus]